jgi:hypothetical protein
MLAIDNILPSKQPHNSGELCPRVPAAFFALEAAFDFSPSRLECRYDHRALLRA